MSFSSYNGILRKIGRAVVLPVNSIKEKIDQALEKNEVDFCVDFGAGTLFWTDYLAGKCKKIYAIDCIYKNSQIINGILCCNSLDDVNDANGRGLFFTSDVLHHLDENTENKIFDDYLQKLDYEIVIVKDIDCNRKFGNALNRMHDKIINGENVRDVNPQVLISKLSAMGYTCEKYNIRKLWYPHFLIIAKKKLRE